MFKRYWWMFLAMLPVGAMLGWFVSAVVTYLTPKFYESEAIIEIKPAIRPFTSETGGPGVAAMMTPQFFATQAELITCRNALERVVSKLELTKRWNLDQDTAIQILRGSVTMTPIKGTDLFNVRVRHTNKVDAKDIAEEVVTAYKGYRAETESKDRESMLHELNKIVREQEDKVEERRKVLATIVRVKGIPQNGDAVNPANDSEQSREEAIRKGLDAQDYIDAKRDFETDQQLLQTLKLKLTNEQIASRIPNNSVEIHAFPSISNLPISPNVTLNLFSGAQYGLLLSPLLALPVIFILGLRKSHGSPRSGAALADENHGFNP